MPSNRLLINSIPKLNEFFQGGVEEGTLVHVYGRYQSGKSLLTMQILYEWVGNGFGNALVIDSENSILNNFGRVWMERFKKRFGREICLYKVSHKKYVVKGSSRRYLNDLLTVLLDTFQQLEIEVERSYLKALLKQLLPKIELFVDHSDEIPQNHNIYVLNSSDIREVYQALGYELNIVPEKKKLSIHMYERNDILHSPISRFIEKNRVRFLVIDSLGGLLKYYKFNVQDFPERASIINALIHSLAVLSNEYGLITIVTNHESRSPMSNYTSFYGGSSVGYGFKYTLYMKPSGVGVRELIGYRAPHLPEAVWRITLKLDEEGFHQDGTSN